MADVTSLYLQAPALREAGERVVSTDEMTGIHALERTHPTIPMGPGRVCSGREGLNLTGASPVVPIARFRHVAIPQFVTGNRTFFAWRTRPGCPEDFALLR